MASFSTLDHFRTTAEIESSLAGLATLTRPAGQLLITLDNPANPLIALRNALPHSLLSSSGLAPYEYGRTLAPAAFRRALHAAGWRVLSLRGALHVPRVLAVASSPLLPAPLLPRLVHSCEALAHLPTHYLTGHFLLALCERR